MKQLLIADIFILIYVSVRGWRGQASLSSLFVQPVAHSPQTQHCGEMVEGPLGLRVSGCTFL